jgi:hypothetical protein
MSRSHLPTLTSIQANLPIEPMALWWRSANWSRDYELFKMGSRWCMEPESVQFVGSKATNDARNLARSQLLPTIFHTNYQSINVSPAVLSVMSAIFCAKARQVLTRIESPVCMYNYLRSHVPAGCKRTCCTFVKSSIRKNERKLHGA